MKCSWRWWHDGYYVQLPPLKPWFDWQRGQIHSLIAMKLACRNDGGGRITADSCRIGEVEGVGTVELVCVGRLLRMGCDSFVMPVCGSVESGEPRSRMSYHENILLRTNGGRRGRDRRPDILACSAWIVSGWVVMVWDTVLFRACWNTYFAYLALRTSALGMGQAVRLGKRNTLCCKSWMEINFYWFYDFLFFICFLLYFVC